jgi:signal transduction histidine kinase
LEKESSSLPPEKGPSSLPPEKGSFSPPPLEKESSSLPPLEKGGKGGFVFIKIADTGPGIPSQLINRIFDPFFTTKSETGGTGLGLSIASKIVKDHNGTIEVTSKEGEGTTFKIILPI